MERGYASLMNQKESIQRKDYLAVRIKDGEDWLFARANSQLSDSQPTQLDEVDPYILVIFAYVSLFYIIILNVASNCYREVDLCDNNNRG